MKETPQEGFATFTYTRASSCSLKKRLHRLNTEMTPNDRRTEVDRKDTHYISELCFDFSRADVICYLPALFGALEVRYSS